MNLKELKDKIDTIIKHLPKYRNPEEFEVVVTTNDNAIGGRAKASVKSVYKGFDWENKQIRIDTEDKLYKKKED